MKKLDWKWGTPIIIIGCDKKEYKGIFLGHYCDDLYNVVVEGEMSN